MTAFSQKTGLIEYKALGLRFTVPQGWVGQEMEGGFLIGHETKAGFIFLMTNDLKSKDQARQQAMQGLNDGNGTALKITGPIEEIGNNGLGAEFSGMLEGSQAKAYIISLINPMGAGVTILSATSPQHYSDEYPRMAKQVANSVGFFKAVTPPVVDEWKKTLQNCRLTYMDSYYSSGPSYDGYSTGGGYSTETRIELCSRGYFNFSGYSSISVDTGGAFASGNDKAAGAGSWTVISNGAGQPVLQLNFHDGNVKEYVLEYKDEKTYLNGERYFRTYDGEYAPNCN